LRVENIDIAIVDEDSENKYILSDLGDLEKKMATKVIATATVRAVKRKLIPTRAAITLVSENCKNFNF
jgi:hypothetical protein